MKKITPLKAIRLKCKEDCCANDRKSWVNCDIEDCALFIYRLGKNPYDKRKGNKGSIGNLIPRDRKNPSVNIEEIKQGTDV
jgi:hypothetical protein